VASSPILVVQSLSRDYIVRRFLFGSPDIVHAVRSVDLSIEPGTTLALVGESGSGKSTLGRCIAGLDRPTSGSVKVNGQDALHLSSGDLLAFRRRVQTIFQDPYASLNPRRKVGQAIMDGMVIHKLYRDRHERFERTVALLERVGLKADHAHRYPHQLSGGQRQRIAIARALALEPEFIIADEAVSALDVSTKAQVIDLLADLQTEHRLTYLFISHDLSIVRHFADRIAIMRAGRIVEEGVTDHIFESPEHPYTQELLAAVPRLQPERRRFRKPRALPGEQP
jgi:ABC-type oligopeptide transport system ATPase subunit